ncbi:DUF3892 domain-containing protein [Bacillus sp. CGMCC 1.16541]|uniref:DUF3892 domain-containing protein n=1 Tax=Bacillus sp. CGMCC 1.16541 TaxID=2185143 RepID=UPI000D73B54A|nr:DUF3892 domain-containing protein [Bacillus sp. CGMCC 1.16541]
MAQKERFVAVKKNGEGDLQAFQTASGQQLSYEEALKQVQAGNIENVSTFTGKDGGTYIRSNPDNDKANNLDNLPEF